MKSVSSANHSSKNIQEPLGAFWTISNLLSVSRVVLLIPIFFFLYHGTENHGNAWAAIFMGIAAVTDFLDGFTARLLHQITRWGRILDPLCDKICILSIGIFLALPSRIHPIPVWFLVLAIARDVIILAGSYFIMGRHKHIPTSMTIGKWTTFFVAILLISFTLDWMPERPWLVLFRSDVLIWICSILVVLSGIVYAYRLIRGDFPAPIDSQSQTPVSIPEE
jgi:CDP-diacylglycerol--glycerol-3-phosphate 3-phosphatidyltransferase